MLSNLVFACVMKNVKGVSTSFALAALEARGIFFITPGMHSRVLCRAISRCVVKGMKVYPGMIIGESSKEGDLEVNPAKMKGTLHISTTSAALDADLHVCVCLFHLCFSIDEHSLREQGR